MLGATIGGLAAGLGAAGRSPRRRWARLALGLLVLVWGAVGGVGGSVLSVLWGLTDHAMAYRNENLLQLNPILLVLAVLVPLGLAGRPVALKWGRRLALALAGLALAGLAIQALPGVDQVNGPVIALLLPIHFGVALGVEFLSTTLPRSLGTRPEADREEQAGR